MAQKKFAAFAARNSARAEATLSTHGVTYLFLALYAVSNVLMYMWGFRNEFIKNAPYRWWIGLARGAGYVLNLNTALVLLLASRLFLTGLRDTALADVLPLDKAFPALHIVVAYTTISAVVIHATFHFVWLIRWQKWDEWGLWSFNMSVVTGCLLTIVFVILFIFARPHYRKTNFRLFYMVHLVGAALFFAILVVHGMYNKKPETYKYVVPALIVYLIDRIVRLFRMSSHSLELSASNSVFMDGSVLQLRIPKPFAFRPGQYAEIMVPQINHEWHPFTIASAQYENNMSFYIKAAGDWTNALYKAFETRMNGTATSKSLELRVRGPFGAPTQEVNKYSRVFLISGGIGATPFASISRQLHHLHNDLEAPIDQSHRVRRGEIKLADKAEQRIRDAIGSIFDVDVQALAPLEKKPDLAQEGGAEQQQLPGVEVADQFDDRRLERIMSMDHMISVNDQPSGHHRDSTVQQGENRRNQDRAEVAALQMGYVANMMRVASRTNSNTTQTSRVVRRQSQLAAQQQSTNVDLKHEDEDVEAYSKQGMTTPDAVAKAQRLETDFEEDYQPARSNTSYDDEFSVYSGDSADIDPADQEHEPSSTASSILLKQMRNITSTLKRQLNPRTSRHFFTTPAKVSANEKIKRQRAARLGDTRGNLLLFLHSSRVTFLLALFYILRMGVTVAGKIFESSFVQLTQPAQYTAENPIHGRWVALAYAHLSTYPSITTAITVLLEFSVIGLASLRSTRRVLEVLMFGPVNIALTAIEFNRYIQNNPGSEILILLQYIIAQAVTFGLVVGRLWRAVGKQGLLEDRPRMNVGADHIPDADFVWTTRHEEDDAWLRRELEPVVHGDAVRLHRYVTQKKQPKDGEEEAKASGKPGSHDIVDVELGRSEAMSRATKSGRPAWDQLLYAACRDTRSDGVVGIFFCGPHKMGEAIRQSAKKIEMWSNLRDAYLRNTELETLMRDVGIKDAKLVHKLRNFGCRVRFVYHEENFS